MKKKNFYYISFILFSLCFANNGYSKNINAEATVITGSDNDIAIAKNKSKKPKNRDVTKIKKKNIIFEEGAQTEKIIELNSVNFIKLKSKANEIFIPDPTIIDVQLLSDNSLYLMGLEPGITSLVINDKNGDTLVNCKVRVTYPLKSIKDAIKELHPDSCVEIVSIDSSIVLKGRVPSPESASEIQDIVGRFIDKEKIINRLVIETSTQVMLKVKIAEVSRALTKSLGINWRAFSSADGLSGTSFGFMAGTTTKGFLKDITEIGGIKEALLDTTEGPLASELKGGRWMFHNGGRRGLSGLIDALSDEAFASVLAEPTLIALSGKKAIFKSGGETGYEVSQSNSDSKTTEFKEWGTSVEFTPIVLSEDRINITVTPKVSTLSFENGRDKPPSLATKEASTTIELGSGESMAIAGLLQKDKSTSSNETPLLADIPLLGALFRSSTVKNTEKEIVIIITPYIVKPSSKQLKTPIDMMPRIFSPLGSLLNRKFHGSKKKYKKVNAAGFSIK